MVHTKKHRFWLRRLLKLALSGVLAMLLINLSVIFSARGSIRGLQDSPKAQAAIVLGAGVKPGGKLSDMLADRVKTSVELYQAGKVEKLLMTGDHGRKSYDEVNAMRKFAESMGVPTQDIFMDHAGFCTYDSMYRAKAIFKVKSAVVVTQKFHLARAVFLARSRGIDAVGVPADKHKYKGALIVAVREVPARVKDFIQAKITRPKPKYLGRVIPITGDGRATHD